MASGCFASPTITRSPVSTNVSRFDFPYTSEVEKIMTRFLFFAASSRTISVPLMFVSIVRTGLSTMSLTPTAAARCKITSASSTSSAISDRFITVSRTYLNPSRPFRCSMFSMAPVDRSSMIVTFSPLSAIDSARWDPMNPAPPVIRYFIAHVPPHASVFCVKGVRILDDPGLPTAPRPYVLPVVDDDPTDPPRSRIRSRSWSAPCPCDSTVSARSNEVMLIEVPFEHGGDQVVAPRAEVSVVPRDVQIPFRHVGVLHRRQEIDVGKPDPSRYRIHPLLHMREGVRPADLSWHRKDHEHRREPVAPG